MYDKILQSLSKYHGIRSYLEHKTSRTWSTKQEPGIQSWWYPPLSNWNWMDLGALVAIILVSSTHRNSSRSGERVRSRRYAGKKTKNTSATKWIELNWRRSELKSELTKWKWAAILDPIIPRMLMDMTNLNLTASLCMAAYCRWAIYSIYQVRQLSNWGDLWKYGIINL